MSWFDFSSTVPVSAAWSGALDFVFSGFLLSTTSIVEEKR